jgi:tRNA(Ile2) C34 agmatinyltransferase TiaS
VVEGGVRPGTCPTLREMAKSKAEQDDRPPICPACGVTMGIVTDSSGKTRFVCLECGFSDG